MKKLFTLFTMLLMMVTASFAAAPDGIGNITVKYSPAGPALDIYFVDQKDVAPTWDVDIKLDGEKISCEYGQDWNELYAYPSGQLAVGKHTIVFPAGSLKLDSKTIYDKECSATFVIADFTATASQLSTTDSPVDVVFKLSEIAKAFGTDAATLASALQDGSATFGLFDAEGQLIGTTFDGPGSYWMKADGSVTKSGQDAVVYNSIISYDASADILTIPVGQNKGAFKGGETWANVFTLKYNGTSKTLGVVLKFKTPELAVSLVAEDQTDYVLRSNLVTIDVPVNAITVTGVEKISSDVHYAIYDQNKTPLAAGILSSTGYAEYTPLSLFEGNMYSVVITADGETLWEGKTIGACEGATPDVEISVYGTEVQVKFAAGTNFGDTKKCKPYIMAGETKINVVDYVIRNTTGGSTEPLNLIAIHLDKKLADGNYTVVLPDGMLVQNRRDKNPTWVFPFTIGDPNGLGTQLKSTLAITDSKWATFVAPYEVTLPEGVTAYTVEGKDDNNHTLILKGAEGKLSANTPVVLYSEKPVEKEYYQPIVEGIPQKGIMVGVLVNTDIRSGYVLQNQNGLVGFYQVNGIKTVPANRAYIAQSASTEGIDDERVKGYFFDTTTALKALDAMAAGKAEIYDMNGRKQSRLQKGINIVNGVKVLVK